MQGFLCQRQIVQIVFEVTDYMKPDFGLSEQLGVLLVCGFPYWPWHSCINYWIPLLGWQ